MNLRTLLLVLCVLAVTCSTAFAHPQHGISNAGALAAGFSHPWLGLDHLLAMIAVGLLSVQFGGRAIWGLPASFLGMMFLGGALGVSGLEFHLVEYAIALSAVILGVALALGRKYPLAAAAAVIGTFGLMHGHAHGTEMPAMAAPALYAAGFLSATLLLHLAGIAGGMCVVRSRRWAVGLQWSGAAISCAGLLLLLKAM